MLASSTKARTHFKKFEKTVYWRAWLFTQLYWSNGFVSCLWGDWFCGLTWERVYMRRVLKRAFAYGGVWFFLRWPCAVDKMLKSSYSSFVACLKCSHQTLSGVCLSFSGSDAWCHSMEDPGNSVLWEQHLPGGDQQVDSFSGRCESHLTLFLPSK